MPRSTAPCEIPDCQGDSYVYQGLLPTVAYRVLWGKLFYNVWMNYQPREMIPPLIKGELCFYKVEDTAGHFFSADVNVRAQ